MVTRDEERGLGRAQETPIIHHQNTAETCPNSPVLVVVRFYCPNEDVEYGFNFKLLRDETIKASHLFETNMFSQVYFSWDIDLSVRLFQHTLKYFANTLER